MDRQGRTGRTGRGGCAVAIVLLAGGCGASGEQGSTPSDDTAAAAGRTENAMADVHVRADLVRSGGFAGLTRRSSLDTGTLPPADAQQLRDIVAGLDLGSLAAAGAPGTPIPDGYTYDLTIVRGPERVHVLLGERTVDPELRPLLGLLQERAQPG